MLLRFYGQRIFNIPERQRVAPSFATRSLFEVVRYMSSTFVYGVARRLRESLIVCAASSFPLRKNKRINKLRSKIKKKKKKQCFDFIYLFDENIITYFQCYYTRRDRKLLRFRRVYNIYTARYGYDNKTHPTATRVQGERSVAAEVRRVYRVQTPQGSRKIQDHRSNIARLPFKTEVFCLLLRCKRFGGSVDQN